jgi:hypothetical protein
MKMLFFSSDSSEVRHVCKEFVQAGIPCEVRDSPRPAGRHQAPPQAELWIHNETDCHKGWMLCVQLGMGFSRRPPRPPRMDDLEEAMLSEKDAPK